MKTLPPATCRILLVRHATAQGNGSFQGQRDVALAAAGRRELRGLCEKCAGYPVRAVYASDLLRARQTADAVARQFGCQVEVRPELREMHFGEWEGLTWKQISARSPKLANTWLEGFPHQSAPGGETLAQFRRRIGAAIGKIVSAHRGECALVVTHAGVTRFVLGSVLGLPARNVFRLAQDPCAINVVDYVAEWRHRAVHQWLNRRCAQHLGVRRLDAALELS